MLTGCRRFAPGSPHRNQVGKAKRGEPGTVRNTCGIHEGGSLVGGGGQGQAGGKLLDDVVKCLLQALALLPAGKGREFGRVGHAAPHILKTVGVGLLVGDKRDAVIEEAHAVVAGGPIFR